MNGARWASRLFVAGLQTEPNGLTAGLKSIARAGHFVDARLYLASVDLEEITRAAGPGVPLVRNSAE